MPKLATPPPPDELQESLNLHARETPEKIRKKKSPGLRAAQAVWKKYGKSLSL